MCSYILGIVLCSLLSALYVFQNADPVTVNIFMLTHTLPQGLLDIMFFASGAVLMWFVSVFAALEIRSKYRSKIKDLETKVTALEDERSSLLNAFKHLPDSSSPSRTAPEPENLVLAAMPIDDGRPMDTVATGDGIEVEKESVSI